MMAVCVAPKPGSLEINDFVGQRQVLLQVVKTDIKNQNEKPVIFYNLFLPTHGKIADFILDFRICCMFHLL